MNTADKTLAARFFFRNCSVSIHTQGELKISRSLAMDPGEVFLNRDFIPAGSPSEFIGDQSDFCRFLVDISPSKASFLKKIAAIGYMLCNKLPRGGRRHRAFLCVNEEKEACANGKTLFANAIAQLCNSAFVCARDILGSVPLSAVAENTNLLILDDVPYCFDLSKFFSLCTDAWHVQRKAQPQLIIPREKVPYVLITSNATDAMLRKDGSFRSRFAVLEFSSYFGPHFPIAKHFSRAMFYEWDSSQWHMFDNFMFYCVLEYLRSYAHGEDIFSLFEKLDSQRVHKKTNKRNKNDQKH